MSDYNPYAEGRQFLPIHGPGQSGPQHTTESTPSNVSSWIMRLQGHISIHELDALENYIYHQEWPSEYRDIFRAYQASMIVYVHLRSTLSCVKVMSLMPPIFSAIPQHNRQTSMREVAYATARIVAFHELCQVGVCQPLSDVFKTINRPMMKYLEHGRRKATLGATRAQNYLLLRYEWGEYDTEDFRTAMVVLGHRRSPLGKASKTGSRQAASLIQFTKDLLVHNSQRDSPFEELLVASQLMRLAGWHICHHAFSAGQDSSICGWDDYYVVAISAHYIASWMCRVRDPTPDARPLYPALFLPIYADSLCLMAEACTRGGLRQRAQACFTLFDFTLEILERWKEKDAWLYGHHFANVLRHQVDLANRFQDHDSFPLHWIISDIKIAANRATERYQKFGEESEDDLWGRLPQCGIINGPTLIREAIGLDIETTVVH